MSAAAPKRSPPVPAPETAVAGGAASSGTSSTSAPAISSAAVLVAAAAAAAAAPGPSKASSSALLTGGPPRPVALRSTSRSVSIITPQSSTLLNASVVRKDEETGEEVRLRPLSDADVLCGRGGLVNGFVGNVAFRELVAKKRDEYRDSKKMKKAQIAVAIVEEVKSRGGLFLHRVDIDSDGGKGTGGTHKNGGGSNSGGGGGGGPSKNNWGTGFDAQGSRWMYISEAKAREKTSQALREGADVRQRSSGNRPVAPGSENASISSVSVAKVTTKDAPPLSVSEATTAKKPRKKRKSKSSSNSSLIAFLPPTVAAFLEEQNPSSANVQQQDEVITSPDDFERIVSRPKGGKQRLAQRLFDWNATKSASVRTNDWTTTLGTVELWTRQVDIWSDALAYLKSTEKQQKEQGQQGSTVDVDDDTGNGGTPKKVKASSKDVSVV